MARPILVDINANQEGWDADITDNIKILRDAPSPLPLHGGTEANLEATFPANQYAQCQIAVNHTSLGWTVYFSDGTNWKRLAFA